MAISCIIISEWEAKDVDQLYFVVVLLPRFELVGGFFMVENIEICWHIALRRFTCILDTRDDESHVRAKLFVNEDIKKKI